MDVLAFSESLQDYAQGLLQILGGIYLFNLINLIFLKRILNSFGIRPRTIRGLPGIITSPFLHGSTEHFLMNAVPFFFIALMMIAILDWDLSWICIEAIAIASGALTWCVGRNGVHIGASGVVTGMFGWVAYWTIYSPTIVNIVILGVLLVYFGSILMGVFPEKPGVSWEGHFMGLVAGVLCAKYPQIVDQYFFVRIEILDIWDIILDYVS